ncbi:MAG: hydrogenase expression/formation protein [Ferrovum myxofaciens]|nr:hydrogenase expression/formation protein [Ferrovum myxofaciens]QKE40112.1 MAG: hydrogenase expression/formation protein [Ferrovum myxofaciens]
MRDFHIPLVGIDSQSEAEEVRYLPLPGEMTTFAMPVVNLVADPEILEAVCTVLENLRSAMLTKRDAKIDLTRLTPDVVELINQSLGQGEVSVIVRNPSNLHIQETVFAGIWRIQKMSTQSVVSSDMLHACAIPAEVQKSALSGTTVVSVPPMQQGIMNAPAVLNELLERSKKYQEGNAAHIINLSLLPMSPEDLAYLYDAFGTGTVSILSRGYGNCRITSTRLANVWWVQYFNSTDQIILNTLEVVDVPEVALAADEDFLESVVRLGEWLSVMREQ